MGSCLFYRPALVLFTSGVRETSVVPPPFVSSAAEDAAELAIHLWNVIGFEYNLTIRPGGTTQHALVARFTPTGGAAIDAGQAHLAATP